MDIIEKFIIIEKVFGSCILTGTDTMNCARRGMTVRKSQNQSAENPTDFVNDRISHYWLHSFTTKLVIWLQSTTTIKLPCYNLLML